MRAVIHDGQEVVNVILIDPDSDFTPPDGLTLVDIDDSNPVGAGWTVNADGTFSEPAVQPVVDTPAPLDTRITDADTYLQSQIDQLTDITLGL